MFLKFYSCNELILDDLQNFLVFRIESRFLEQSNLFLVDGAATHVQP